MRIYTSCKIGIIYLVQFILYAFPYVGEMLYWEAYEDPELTSDILILGTPTTTNYETYVEGYKNFDKLDKKITHCVRPASLIMQMEGRTSYSKTKYSLLTEDILKQKWLLFEEGPANDYEEDLLLIKSNIPLESKTFHHMNPLYGKYSEGEQVQIGFHFMHDLLSFDEPDPRRTTKKSYDPHYTYRKYKRSNYPEDYLDESILDFDYLEYCRKTEMKQEGKLEEVRAIIKKTLIKNFRRNMKKHIGKGKTIKIYNFYCFFSLIKNKFSLPEKSILLRKKMFETFCDFSLQEKKILKKVVKIKKKRKRGKFFKAKIDEFKQIEGDFFDEAKKLYLKKKKQ
ncbi:hypothetical protein [Lutibacter sp.]